MLEIVFRFVVAIVLIAAGLAFIRWVIYTTYNPTEHDQESEDVLRQLADEPERNAERDPKSSPKRSKPTQSVPVKEGQSTH
jgi:hypothetical protein